MCVQAQGSAQGGAHSPPGNSASSCVALGRPSQTSPRRTQVAKGVRGPRVWASGWQGRAGSWCAGKFLSSPQPSTVLGRQTGTLNRHSSGPEHTCLEKQQTHLSGYLPLYGFLNALRFQSSETLFSPLRNVCHTTGWL